MSVNETIIKFMKKLFTNSVIGLLLLSLIISTVGITISIHACGVDGSKSFVIDFDQNNDAGTCSACAEEEESHKHKTAASMSMHCDMQEGQKALCDFNEHNGECCHELTKQIKADYDVVMPKNNADFFRLILGTVMSIGLPDISVHQVVNNFYNIFDRGLSPPYSSDYIHFISSVLE